MIKCVHGNFICPVLYQFSPSFLGLLFNPKLVYCSPDSSGEYSSGSWRVVLIITAILIAVIIITIVSAAMVAHWDKIRCRCAKKKNSSTGRKSITVQARNNWCENVNIPGSPFRSRIFSVCAPPPPPPPPPQYVMLPPVTEHVPLHSKSLCENMARAL